MSELVRYVLFHRGGPATAGDLARLKAHPGVRVVEDVGARAMLADISVSDVRSLQRSFPGWVISREVIHAAPRPVRAPGVKQSHEEDDASDEGENPLVQL